MLNLLCVFVKLKLGKTFGRNGTEHFIAWYKKAWQHPRPLTSNVDKVLLIVKQTGTGECDSYNKRWRLYNFFDRWLRIISPYRNDYPTYSIMIRTIIKEYITNILNDWWYISSILSDVICLNSDQYHIFNGRLTNKPVMP